MEKLLLLCFHYNPINGKYGASILYAMRVGGVLTMVALFALLVRLIWSERNVAKPIPKTGRI